MSVEKSFEAWEEVQRHGLDLADRLAQGFSGLIQSHISPPSFPWQNQQKAKLFVLEFPNHNFVTKDFGVVIDKSGINGVSAIFDIGSRIGQAGADLGASLNGLVHQFFRRLPVPFRHDEIAVVSVRADSRLRSQSAEFGMGEKEDLGALAERLRNQGYAADNDNDNGSGGSVDNEKQGFNLESAGFSGTPQGHINISSTYETRNNNLENTLVARGELWRVEASNVGSTSGNENNSLFLLQLGPVLFLRDTTLLLPLHLSKQHLFWYGYDRKNGMHSFCPTVWSKHRRWLLMSMICLNPLACSFVDLQFPNGQLTYVSGEGLTTSAFMPLFGGLLQAQGQYPGEMRYSFSCKNKWGTRITPMVQFPDKSFTLGLSQALAWKRSGIMMKPTIQFSVCPTFGGSNPGLWAEVIHTVQKDLNLIFGCALTEHPSASASISVGRSKWNGNVGNLGVVVRVDTPLSRVGRPSFSIQINKVIEF